MLGRKSNIILLVFLPIASLFASTQTREIKNYKEKTFFELETIDIKQVKKLNAEGKKYCVLFQNNKQIYCDFKGLDKINIIVYTADAEIKLIIKNSEFAEQKGEENEVGDAMVKKYRELKKNFAIISKKNDELLDAIEGAKAAQDIAEKKLKKCTVDLIEEIKNTNSATEINEKKLQVVIGKFESERSGLIAVMTGNKKYKKMSEQSTINLLIDELEELKKSQRILQKENLKLLKRQDKEQSDLEEKDGENIGSKKNEQNFQY